MDDDQQFCLRWNNHQSTLISVIDTLLVKETLVDCTLAAEGKYLKAHKVVLCACSPYFETLLSQQFDKHPIIILKDVKFQELKAMMDYMYRGEVNISQDQLAALLKAAESLQIKGLSDNRKSDEPPRKREALAPPVAKSPPPPAPSLPHVKGLTIEQKRQTKQLETEELNNLSREGSQSPIPRKRKKPRRRASQDDGTVIDNHDASNSSDATALSNIPLASAATSIPVASTSQSKPTDNVPAIESVESIASSRSNKNNIVTSPARSTDAEMSSSQVPVVVKEKLEPHSELMLEPKAEYIDEDLNDDSVEDLTLDDDDMNEMGLEHARPGPSHGGQGEGSGQGFGSWHMAADRSQDEVFMAAQEAVGAHRDSQGTFEEEFIFKSKPCKKLIRNLSHGLTIESVTSVAIPISSITGEDCQYIKSSDLISKDVSESTTSSSAPSVSGVTAAILEDTGEYKYQCNRCGRSYINKSRLNRHLQYECGEARKRLACHVCGKKFSRPDNLRDHERIHYYRENSLPSYFLLPKSGPV